MPIPILMPALSPTMEDGTLSRWLVKEGDAVAPGDVLAEIETDKATMEVEAAEEGVIGKLVVPAGSEHVRVNAPIAVLLEDGEDAGALEGFELPAAPEPAQQMQTLGGNGSAMPPPAAALTQVATAQQNTLPPATGRVNASPLAKRMAAQNAVDLSRLIGSGPHGRIIKRDIDTALNAGLALSQPATTPAATATGPQPMPDKEIFALYEADSYELEPHPAMRKIIAERLTQAKATIPHFYLTITVGLDALLAARKQLNAASPADGPDAYRVSVNDYIIKAMARALQQVPAANAIWTSEGMMRHKHSDVAVAVAVEGGLFTPVIRKAGDKSLIEISRTMKDLAGRARNKKLAPHEYQGGTTAISNLGMFGITQFDAVINPPHASILAIGAGEKRPVVVNNEITIATQMTVTLSCDHRVIDGALGAELLAAFKQGIESPDLIA